MVGKKGKPVRPVNRTGILAKRFRRVVGPSKRIAIPALPFFVVRDLRRGSLDSLDRHLSENDGPLDRTIAQELHKLISGSASDSKYRLVVVDHPDAPKDKGGRPTTEKARQKKIRARHGELIAEGTKGYIAEEILREEFDVDGRTIQSALNSADVVGPSEEQLAETLKMREKSLRALRKKSRSSDQSR